MTPIAAMVEQMLSAGISAEIIVLAVRTAEESSAEVLRNSAEITTVDEQAERRRAADRSRKAAQALRNSAETPQTRSLSSFLKETTEEVSKKEDTNTRDDDFPSDAFDQFWSRYPHKVGKHDAKQKFKRARQSGVKWADFLAGLDRYIAAKPIDRPWLNPSTYLNQRRWDDQPAANGTMARDLTPIENGKYYARAETDQLFAWDAHAKETRGKGLPRDRDGGWWVESEWPPGFTPPPDRPEGSNDVRH